MQVSFIIPLYNCLPLTQACVASLQATLPPGLAHEIILVDDGSTDGTRAWLQGLREPCRVLLNERNLGYAGANNRAAASARGEILVLLNNDLRLSPGWLEPLLACLRDPRVAVAGNIQDDATTGRLDHAGIAFNAKGKPEHLTCRPWLARLVGHRTVPAVTGACCAIRAATWRELGGFDEAFVNGGEDVDLCLRARRRGGRTVVSLRSRIRHHISQSPGRKANDERNSRLLAQRWHADIAGLNRQASSRAVLCAAWSDPRDYADPTLARQCCLFRLRLLPRPTARMHAAFATFFSLEETRWAELLDGQRPRDPRTIAPTLFPLRVIEPQIV